MLPQSSSMPEPSQHHFAKPPVSERPLTTQRDVMKQRNEVQAKVIEAMTGLSQEDALSEDTRATELQIAWVNRYGKLYESLFDNDPEFQGHVLAGNVQAVIERLSV